MKQINLKMRMIPIFLILSILLSSYGFASAETAITSDIKGHWAEKQLVDWKARGLINGYEVGSFKPNQTISRAEFLALINRSFGFVETAEISFTDLNHSDWEYNDVQKAIKVGYLQGYEDNTIRTKNEISRQEVAVIIQRLLGLSAAEDKVSSFIDSQAIASWSKKAVEAAAENNIMSGYNDISFKPEKAITRAEAVVTLERALQAKTVEYTKAGIYGPAALIEVINGDVVIEAADVTLQNLVINGKLLIADSVGEGNVYLNNVTVKGVTTINGGGSNSIHFNNTTLLTVIVNKKDGDVRIVAEGTTNVQQINVQTSAKIESNTTSGTGFDTVTMSGELPLDSKVTLSGAFDHVDIQAKSIHIDVLSGSINQMRSTTGSKDVAVNLDKEVKVESLEANANMKISGTGTINKAVMNNGGGESTFEKPPIAAEYKKDGVTTSSPTPKATPSPAPDVSTQPGVIPPGGGGVPSNGGNPGNNGDHGNAGGSTPTPTPTPVPAAVIAVSAIDATTVKVTFDKSITTAAIDFAVTDSANTEVAISSATLVDAGTAVILKVVALTVGNIYTVIYGGVAKDVVATTTDDTTTPVLVSAVSVTSNLVRATFGTRNINKDTLVAANFTLDNNITVTGVKFDTATMAKDSQDGNTVLLLDVTGLSTGKVYVLTSKLVASYEGAKAVTSTLALAGKDADTATPAVTGAASVAGYQVAVTFNEDGKLDASALVLTNYTITPALTITNAEFKTNDFDDNVVTLTTADQKSSIVYKVTVNGVSDGKNVMTAAQTISFTGVDKAPNQSLKNVIAKDTTKVLVTFDYDANATALVPANYAIDNGKTILAAAFKADITQADGLDQTKVILTTSAMNSGILYKLTISTAVQDFLGQGLKETGTAYFAGKDPDTSFDSITAASIDKNTVSVTFGEEVDRITATKLANYKFSTLGHPSSVTLNAAGTVAILKVATQTGGVVYTLTVNNLKDIAGNVISTNTTATFTGRGDVIDRLKVTGIMAVSKSLVKVTFNQKLAENIDLDESLFTLNAGSDTLTVSNGAIATAGNDFIILTVTPVLSSGKVYTLTVSANSDLVGRVTNHTFGTTLEVDRKRTFVGSDLIAATFAVTGVVILDKTHAKVNFDAAIVDAANTEAGVLTFYTNSAMDINPNASVAGVIQSNDKKSLIFTFSSNFADSSVYYAKLTQVKDGTTKLQTDEGAVLAVDTDKAYKSLTAVTGNLVESEDTKLNILSASMIDINTIQLRFNVDTNKNLPASQVTLAKASAAVITATYVSFSDERTANIYFTGAAALDNSNGIHYVKVAEGTLATLVGGQTAFAANKSVQTFVRNTMDNAKPTIASVEPLTASIIKIVTSEKVFIDNVRTPFNKTGLILFNNTTHTLILATDYTVTNDGERVFYLTLTNGSFLTNSNYRIGFNDGVYGEDGYVSADVYNTTVSQTANSMIFVGY